LGLVIAKTNLKDDRILMRTRKALAVLVMMAVQSLCALADNTVSQPNPAGEAEYYPRLLRDMLPFAIIVCAFLAACIVTLVHRWLGRGSPGSGHSAAEHQTTTEQITPLSQAPNPPPDGTVQRDHPNLLRTLEALARGLAVC
jgi:hypothetical protein